MDTIIESLNPLILDSFFIYIGKFLPNSWKNDFLNPISIYRLYISSFLILWIGGFLAYFIFALFSYIFIFDKKQRKHPKFLPNQELLEIWVSFKSIPLMALITSFITVAEILGYSQLHEKVPHTKNEWIFQIFNVFWFLFFTDSLIYWIHRGLHHPFIYTAIHKLHHKWIISTPFASHAFHPIDGFLQSVPYHIFAFIFPMNKILHLVLFILVNFWTISIHDGSSVYKGIIINGADHHKLHHRQFNFNYGQYFTFWDRICNTHRDPVIYLKKSSD